MWIYTCMEEYWSGFGQQTMMVSVDETRDSVVLDQNGEPFKLEKKHPVGFDLRIREGTD